MARRTRARRQNVDPRMARRMPRGARVNVGRLLTRMQNREQIRAALETLRGRTGANRVTISRGRGATRQIRVFRRRRADYRPFRTRGGRSSGGG